MAYMILPMPKDGSMTLGTISSTVGDTQRHAQVRATQTISHLVDCLIFSYDGPINQLNSNLKLND